MLLGFCVGLEPRKGVEGALRCNDYSLEERREARGSGFEVEGWKNKGR
jgi:hypothetical protein